MTEIRYPALNDDADDGRLDAPAFHRNVTPIAGALTARLSDGGGALFEVGSGSGQHAAVLAQALPALTYWPSDPEPSHRASIDAWARRLAIANIRPAMDFDATATDWAEAAGGATATLRAVLCVNVIHIAPWAVAEGLLTGASKRLAKGGFLAVYGPFRFHGAHISDSNDAFDRSLRLQNPDWGVRDVQQLDALADASGLLRAETIALPSNNHMIVFRHKASPL